MLQHHIQNGIIQLLAREKATNFASLKPKNIESNAFNYHLRALVKEGFVTKNEDGLYQLTRLGMRLGLNSHLSAKERLSQAHSVLLMTVVDDQKGMVLRERTAHPMYGYLGFIHGEPNHTELVTDTAKKRFKEYTGLTADFKVRGFGYTRFMGGGELESFTSFTLLVADKYNGELKQGSSTGRNMWITKEAACKHEKLFPNMQPLFESMDSKEPFWLDLLQEI